ncbi:MAG: signal peptidase II [Lachnospiraceae bacterium]|nr:signal peptidase II [Lachnospiraceae bacterium]MDY5497333.1 signal peptidase II [Anaerobutyricum sp.]
MERRIKSLVPFCILLLADQLTKLWALRVLRPISAISVIPGIFELLYVENRGAAFGILQNRQWFFLLISFVVLFGLLWLSGKIPEETRFHPLRVCLYFIGAGAVGNMIDRIFRKYVVDFIYFSLIDFPVFNVADIYVTVSAVALVGLILFYYGDEDFERIFPKKETGRIENERK